MYKLFRLQEQYCRLLKGLGGQQTTYQITLNEVAGHMCCTSRHARALLHEMQSNNWLIWQSTPGRSKKAILSCLMSENQIREEQAQKLLDENKLEHAVNLLGDKGHLQQLIFSQLGYRFRQGKAILNILYYRPFKNLMPNPSLRKSEKHILKYIFSGLVQYDETTDTIIGDIAHSWECISSQHWQFYLRPGVYFHHGRLLTSEDIIYSLKRLTHSKLYAHIREINSPSPLVIDIFLDSPDVNFLHILASTTAKIIPREWQSLPNFEQQPIGTGPFRVLAHVNDYLKISAFDQYFGYRSLIDEIIIWLMPELANHSVYEGVYIQRDKEILSLNPIASMPIFLSEEKKDRLIEKRLEDGCYFLLFDKRSTTLNKPHIITWIYQQISGDKILNQLSNFENYWEVANAILPSWDHSDILVGPDIDKPTELTQLTITYYANQPEYAVIAKVIKQIFTQYDIQTHIECVDYEVWKLGEYKSDIWLGSISFNPPHYFNIFTTFHELPIFQYTNGCNEHDIKAWRTGEFSIESWSKALIQTNSIFPLFHHWLYIHKQPALQNIEINSLGWFDFKKAWYK